MVHNNLYTLIDHAQYRPLLSSIRRLPIVIILLVIGGYSRLLVVTVGTEG